MKIRKLTDQKWVLSQNPTTCKYINKSLGLGRWYKSIKNRSTIGGTIIANGYGDTKKEAEIIANLIVETHNKNLVDRNI